MSKDVTEKEAALIVTAIAAYLAKPGLPRAEEPSERTTIAQPSEDLRSLIRRVAELEKKVEKLDRTVGTLIKRVRKP